MLHRPRLAAVDEDPIKEVEELVAGGPRDGPALRQRLARAQNLLGHDEKWSIDPVSDAGTLASQARKYSAGA